jgi:predicted nucleic acid-binding protein
MARYILFADTNVLLDALLQRNAAEACKKILLLAEKTHVKLYTSSSSLLTTIYFLKKSGMPAKDLRESIADLLKLFSICTSNEQDFLAALDSGFSDLEDAVMYQTALQIKGVDYFITSNIKDFKKAKRLSVISPMDFVKVVEKQEL